MHILGVGLAVHEKLVHPEMRPLHKKLVDQFHMMRTGLHHVSGPTCGSVFLFEQCSLLFLLIHRHIATSIHACLCTGCCCLFICNCFNVCVSSVNIQSSIWLGPSRVYLVWTDLALQAAQESTLPEASSPPTAT